MLEYIYIYTYMRVCVCASVWSRVFCALTCGLSFVVRLPAPGLDHFANTCPWTEQHHMSRQTVACSRSLAWWKFRRMSHSCVSPPILQMQSCTCPSQRSGPRSLFATININRFFGEELSCGMGVRDGSQRWCGIHDNLSARNLRVRKTTCTLRKPSRPWRRADYVSQMLC